MSSFLLITFVLLSFPVFSQNYWKAVVEGDDLFFDFEDYSEDGPIGNLEFLKGCSWYCGGEVHQIHASSELDSSKGTSYRAKNAHDFEATTAWVEGAEGYGIGESITYVFDYVEEPERAQNLGINKLLIANGYKKSRSLWEANSRVKQLRMYVNKEHYADIELIDHFEIQTVEIDSIHFNSGRVEVTFEILDVFPGSKYKDTAISLLMFEGFGVH